MQVRIKSGNQAGVVVDMPQLEAEANIATGFAELVDPKKDQAALDENKADVPDVSANKAERLVGESPSAKSSAQSERGETGKATPTPNAARKR